MFFIRRDGSAGANFSFSGWPYAAGARCPSGEGYVRFALTMPVEKIGEAVQAIKNSGILG